MGRSNVQGSRGGQVRETRASHLLIAAMLVCVMGLFAAPSAYAAEDATSKVTDGTVVAATSVTATDTAAVDKTTSTTPTDPTTGEKTDTGDETSTVTDPSTPTTPTDPTTPTTPTDPTTGTGGTTDGTDKSDGTDAADTSTTDTTKDDKVDGTGTTQDGTATATGSDVTTTGTGSTLDGIDIFNGNGDIDISKLNNTDFVIVKATQGTYHTNSYYRDQADAALASGKLLGFYHFADGSEGADAEADFFVTAIKDYVGKAILCLDWENSYVNGSLVTDALSQGTSYAKEFLDHVYALTGVRGLIYMSKSVTNEYDWSSVSSDYGLWVAQYGNNSEFHDYQTEDEIWTDSNGFGSWDSPTIFQYSSNTYVPGYDAKVVDTNMFYGTSSDWMKLASSYGHWVDNGDGTYGYAKGDTKVENDWIVTGVTPGLEISGLQRYWIGSDGFLAMGRLVDPTTSLDSNADYCALALSDGTILRGRYVSADGNIYLGDNDGRLGSGWVVSGYFTDGLQRYWIDVDKHYATVGFFSVAGSDYYGIPTVGYVLRGGGTASDGTRLYADNDGRLASGWLVTDAFGQGLQRYWCVKGTPVSNQLVDTGNGWWTYATADSYVVRGAYVTSDGTVYVADNDGRLAGDDAGGAGAWVVSASFGQGLQRYWIESHAARTGFFSVAGSDYYGIPTVGYVLRGTMDVDGNTVTADNDGVIC